MRHFTRILLAGVAALAALAGAAPAAAGCWATAGLKPPPAGTAAGTVWTAEITVLQHGRNPLPDARDARPTVSIANQATGDRRTFTATPSDPAKGRYEARVVFPAAGRWSFEVFDGFTSWDGQPAPCAQTHTFGAVAIGGPTSGSAGGGSFPVWPVAGTGAGILLALAGVVVARRRLGSRAPASV